MSSKPGSNVSTGYPALDKMVNDAENNPPDLIRGKWCLIQMNPILQREERLNIGVAFKAQRGKVIVFRLLTSMERYRAVYGDRSMDNLNFLLAMLAEASLGARTLQKVSPHILYRPWKPAQGISVKEILDSMFEAVVAPLGEKP